MKDFVVIIKSQITFILNSEEANKQLTQYILLDASRTINVVNEAKLIQEI